MNRTKKYLLALLPALVLWAGCSNMMEELGKTAASGPPDTTVYIYTADELNAVRNDLAGYYVLMVDIDLSGYAAGEGWVPIGDSTNRFTGTLDGNGHTISNLTINRSAGYQGLFGRIGAGGTIINLGVHGSVTGYYYAGCLAGCNDGVIRGCYATGDVDGESYLGGLAGENFGTISDCHATGDVDGSVYLGGLVGYNAGTIRGCYATGDVNGSVCLGGIVGSNCDVISLIENCYATGSITGTSNSFGGLSGSSYGIIRNCYSLGPVSGGESDYGGLLGRLGWSASISSCYYYQGTNNGYGTQVPFADMKRQETFIGWDFTSVWAIDDTGTINSGYPYLRSIMP